jgi:monoterpene epsilon-lactone hydrolase
MGQAVINAVYKQFSKISDRIKAKPDMGLEDMRFLLEELHVLTAEPIGVTYEEVDAGGVPSILARPIGAASDRVIVYTHGGGCVTNSAQSHRKMAGHLAKAAGVHTLILDYRLAPEHTFPAQLEDTVVAHRWLRRQGYVPAHTATAGDSAGGNLAITSVLKLRELGEALPAAVIAISPWLDMEAVGESFETNADSDALVSRDLSLNMAGLYLGDASRTDPLANPLYADLAGFPPVFVTVGDAEMLMADGERFVKRAQAAGVDTALEYGRGQQHIYQIMAGRSPEADASIAAAAAWLRPRLGL